MIRPASLLALQIIVALLALLFWHVGSTVPLAGKVLLPPFFFSTPAEVLVRVYEMFTGGEIWRHLWITLAETVLAFAFGSLGGIVFGFWFARKPILAAVFDPYIKMGNALPRVILAPIFALWFGLGIWSKVVLGISLVFFIVFFNVYQGVKEVNVGILSNARMMRFNEGQLFRHVYWPSAMSWMFSSLHSSVGFALVGAVVGEYLGSAAGLGYLIHQAEGTFDVTGVYAGMLILAAFVLVLDRIVVVIENHLLVWRPAPMLA
jgi:NitT/TauT family transport system permease protein